MSSVEDDYVFLCPECKEWKARSLFYADKRNPNGVSWRCKECGNAYSRAHRKTPKYFEKKALRNARTPEPRRWGPVSRAAALEKIFSMCEPVPEAGCWIWMGGATPLGYGQMLVGFKTRLVQREAWMAANGPIPDGLLVCHKCDTPFCVNPNHLFVGTYKDNSDDMRRKGRAHYQKRASILTGAGAK